MELYVEAEGSARGVSSYTIEPARLQPRVKSSGDLHYPEDLERLKMLCPRIEQMARRQLGKAFVDMHVWGTFLELRVKQGTSKNPKTKFQLRDLFGWVCLFDSEVNAVKE